MSLFLTSRSGNYLRVHPTTQELKLDAQKGQYSKWKIEGTEGPVFVVHEKTNMCLDAFGNLQSERPESARVVLQVENGAIRIFAAVDRTPASLAGADEFVPIDASGGPETVVIPSAASPPPAPIPEVPQPAPEVDPSQPPRPWRGHFRADESTPEERHARNIKLLDGMTKHLPGMTMTTDADGGVSIKLPKETLSLEKFAFMRAMCEARRELGMGGRGFGSRWRHGGCPYFQERGRATIDQVVARMVEAATKSPAPPNCN